MVAASTLKARMAGLLRDRIEVTNVNQFKGCDSIDDVARNLLIELCGFSPTPKMIELAKVAFAQFQPNSMLSPQVGAPSPSTRCRNLITVTVAPF